MWTAYTSSFADKYFVGISTAGRIGANKMAGDPVHSSTVGFVGCAYSPGWLGVLVGHETTGRFVEDDYSRTVEVRPEVLSSSAIRESLRGGEKRSFGKVNELAAVVVQERTVGYRRNDSSSISKVSNAISSEPPAATHRLSWFMAPESASAHAFGSEIEMVLPSLSPWRISTSV